MGIKPMVNKELEVLEQRYNDRRLLWSNVEKFINNCNLWLESPF